jgi:protein involved in polysaccharide export with SLBB domain
MLFRQSYLLAAGLLALLIILASPLGSLGNAQEQAAAGLDAPAAAAAGEGGETYILGVGDRLRVNVFGENDLSGEFDVDSGGAVRLPLIGQVSAAGMTVSNFERDVEAKLEDGYLRDPRVSVEVTN